VGRTAVIVATFILLLVLVGRTLYLSGRLGETELFTLNNRRQYFPPPVARLFQNKYSAAFQLARNEFFSYLNLDRRGNEK